MEQAMDQTKSSSRTGRTGRTALLAASLAGLLAACATGNGYRAGSPHVDDGTITSHVRTALADDPVVRARQVDVVTRDGTVQLNGFVDTTASTRRAGELAGQVPGVRHVDNNLVVRNTSTTVGESIDDSVLTVRVKAALVAEPTTKARQISVETLHGVVQLSGFVDSADERAKAGMVARGITGVTDVHNDLAIGQAR
jgi:hyperosmotically inducible protein